MNRHMIAVLLCLLLFGCGGDDSATSSSVGPLFGRTLPSDSEILAKAYDVSYQLPDYFYVDERADTVRSYTVYHVKDVSLEYELCTNDFYEAMAWEIDSNDSRAVSGQFIGSIENDRYFEFIRELSNANGAGNTDDPTSPGFSRVFKCDYVVRDGVDRNARNGNAGAFNSMPESSDAIRIFSEYMWQFTFFWPAEKKVLETFSSETSTAHEHTLLLSFKTRQGTGDCDLIELVDWVFRADKSNGQITKDFNYLYSMHAELLDGIPEMCSN